MELVDGQPLSALLRPEQPMDPGAVRELLAQAADGLGAAHAAGIVHRDVKPANLLVTPDRQVKVTDFGIARAAEGMGLTATGEVMGTPQYISPEQAEGYPATPASDVYSLGVVAFECLAGHRPFTADSPIATALAHIREPVPALPEGTPSDLGAVVRRSMSKLPQDRYADGAGLAAALRDPATAATAVVGNVPPPADETRILSAAVPAAPAPIPGPVPTTSDPKRTGGSLLPVLVPLAVAVVVALVVLFVLRSSGDDNGDSPGHRRSPSQGATSQAPTSQAPTTQAPTSEAPTTQAPTSQAPTSQAPTSQAPTTQAPTSQGPTSQAPTSAAPTSQAPTSQAPTSAAPTSRAATSAPASQAPASAAPSKPSSSAAAPAAPTGTGNRGEGEAR
jgi:serine/threonine-protein kinase